MSKPPIRAIRYRRERRRVEMSQTCQVALDFERFRRQHHGQLMASPVNERAAGLDGTVDDGGQSETLAARTIGRSGSYGGSSSMSSISVRSPARSVRLHAD